jgi:uncharacterized protein
VLFRSSAPVPTAGFAIPLVVGATASRLAHAYAMLTSRSLAGGEIAVRTVGAMGTYLFGAALAVTAALPQL